MEQKRPVALTHGGKFHADDVFSTALLQLIYPDITVQRTFSVPDEFDGIVYDIGGGAYDHHGNNAPVRANGVPYAAFGLLWQKFGASLVGAEEAAYFDEHFIAPLDLDDNTGCGSPLASAIGSFNPGWDSTADADAQFYKATAFAKEILENKIEQIRGDARAQKLVEAALAAMQDGIAVLPRFAPWKRTAKGNSDVQFVVYPDQRGGYAAQAVDDPNSPERALKCPFPLAWAGLREGEIAAVSGIPTLRFCHKSRFLATAESKEDILEACRAAQREQERLHRPIRAVICDCDGTIVSEVQHEPSDALLYELECAKRKGAVVIIASGRILPIIPAKLRGIADYFVCGNGALAADKTGETLFKDAWSTEQTEGFLRFCRQNNAALSFFFEENYSVYFGLKSFCTFYGVTIGNTDCLTDGSALSRHHTEAPYGAFYIGSDVALAAYLTENPDLQAAPFMAGYYDIYKKTTNKAKMIERVLELSGLNWQDAIAFGDGANDIEMLRCAGTGYAMENAREEAKCAADKIAPPVNEDGVAKVLRELFGTLEL